MSSARPAFWSVESDSTDAKLAARLAVLPRGGLLTLVGLDIGSLTHRVPDGARRLLLLDFAGIALNPNAAIARILDDLAALSVATWPAWPPARLPVWRRAADRLAAAGRPPRFRHVPFETQLPELLAVAGDPALVCPVDPVRSGRAAPLIATLEWCCRHGAAALALLAEPPPAEAPWDRILHDALLFEALPPPPAIARMLPPLSDQADPRGSAVERRMRAALAADPELTGLFEDEVTLRLGPLGPTPRVDLLWPAGKIVVELDGAEHQRDPNYGADRHRDYELLVAGYLVLRLTNAEVELDLGRSLEKVRRVVKLRSLA